MMHSRLTAALATLLLSLAISAFHFSADARPLTSPSAMPAVEAAARPAADAGLPLELAHGCHRGIQRDYAGWHFHTRACVKRPTPPPGLYDAPAYRRFYRGPICSYRCRHVGPVKTCQQVCR